MEFKELISDFSTRHGLEGLDVEDNTVAIDVDGISITFVTDGDIISTIAELANRPPKARLTSPTFSWRRILVRTPPSQKCRKATRMF